jgi:predicted NBD/HSP70 family sugar kinase
MVSAADPVDRVTGRTVHLPGTPFLLGELSPADILADVVLGPVTVDNDVNWAARAEREIAADTWTDAFYLYLGEGLGGAVISDGEVRRGGRGIAGEVAHMITVGPDGKATRFLDVFGALGLRYPESTAVNVSALTTAVGGRNPAGTVLSALAQAIGGILASVTALCDPQLIVLGGPWGGRPAVVDAVRAAAVGLRGPVQVRAAVVTEDAPLAGARTAAIRALGDSIVDYRRTLAPKAGPAAQPADALAGAEQGPAPAPLVGVFVLGGRVGGVEALERAWTVVRLRRGAEMTDAELVHELVDKRRAFITHELLPAPEPGAAGAPVEAPVAEGVDDRERLDASFGQAVAGALPARRGAAGEDSRLDEPHEAVGQDVRGDALDRPGEQHPEVAAVAKDDVAQHEHRPAVSEHLDGGVDRASGPWLHDSSLTGISPPL